MSTRLDIPDLPDEQLAALAAREGSDGPAFVALVQRYQERVWRICYKLLGEVHEAHDEAQEVLVRMFSHRAQFEGRSKYSTWVHGIAVRTCLMVRRGRGRQRKREAALAAQIEPSHRAESSSTDLSLDLMKMLDTLDEEDRAMLILKYAEEQTFEDLAESFGLSLSACKMRVRRACEKLKQRFPDHRFGDSEPTNSDR